MLKLGRRAGESIIIGDDIVVTILRIQGLQVSVGIEAPKDIPIVRDELLKKGAKNEQD